MGRSPVRHGSDAGEEQVLALVREHAGDLLRLARRFSICVEDAQDAYQRTLEKLVRRMRGEPPEDALKWARTVLRHEALAIRGEREQMLGRLALEHDRHRDEESLDPADRVERFERLAHTAEALRGLKPQEMTALALRAEGLSYKEICSRTGWSYTRCNRAVSEGRRSLLQRLRAIESGAECARWLPLLSLLADGEATARELAELRPHLRSCTACRATLRGFYAAPQQVAALLPPLAGLPALGAATAGVSGGGFNLGRHLEALAQSFTERANTTVLRFHSVIDTLPGTKLAAVAASTVAVAGGGAAIEQAATAGSSAGGSEAVAATGAPSPVAATPISVPGSGTGAPPPASDPAVGTSAGAVIASSPAAAAAPGAASAPSAGPLAEFALEPFAAASPASTASSATAAAGTAVFQGTSGAGAAVFPAMSSAGAAVLPATSPAAATASPADAPTPGAATADEDANGSLGSADGSRDGAAGSHDGAADATASRPRRPSTARPATGSPATHHTAPAATAAPARRPEFTPSAPPPAPPQPATPVFSNPRPAAPSGAEFTTP